MDFFKDRFEKVFLKNDVIGLDIGCSTIKCVVLKGSAFSYKIKHYGIQAIPDNLIQDNCIQANKRLSNCIQQMLVRLGVSTNCCVLAFPDTLINSKMIRVDCSAVGDIELAVNLAIEKHIPYTLDEIYFDYQLLDRQNDENFLSIFFVVCKKQHLDVRLQLIQQANLIPQCIEPNSYAIERAYTRLYPDALSQAFILIDVGFSQLTCLFLGGGKGKIHRFSERIDKTGDKEILLQQVKRCIHTIILSYPYYEFRKLFLIGSNLSFLQMIVEKIIIFYPLKAEILSYLPFSCMDGLSEEAFNSLFPALFLSFGLALRGLMKNHIH